jgi:hypothetical protein
MTTISLLPASVNYDIYQGDTFAPPPITVYNGTELMDFTGATFEMVIYSQRTSEVVDTITSEITIPANGQIQITIAADVTNTYPTESPLSYDLKWIAQSGNIRTLLRGNILVQSDIVSE